MSAPTNDAESRFDKYLVVAGAPTVIGLVLQYVVAPSEAMWGHIELAGLGLGVAAAFTLWVWRSVQSAR